jgi:hypothetical protein
VSGGRGGSFAPSGDEVGILPEAAPGGRDCELTKTKIKIKPAATMAKATQGAVFGTFSKSAFSTPPFNLAPQAEQKFPSPVTALPHWGQTELSGGCKETPQEAQKRASVRFSLWQDGQTKFSIIGFN